MKSLFLAFSISTLPALGAPVGIPLEDLVEMDYKDIPEQVRVIGMTDPRERILLDAHFRILEKLPTDWKYTGKISMSEKYSRAGLKSVRWDYSGGDTIRIKDLGVISRLKHIPMRPQVELFAPFEIGLFIEKDLPRNTEFIHLYLQRENRKRELKLVKFTYYLTYGGTWVTLGGGSPNERGSRQLNGELVSQMPEGLQPPAENEILIRIPKVVTPGTLYLDRILTCEQLPSISMVNNGKYQPYEYDEKSNTIHYRATPITFQTRSVLYPFIPDKPIDPKSFTIHSPSDMGYFAEKPPIPKSLSSEQQTYLDEIRAGYFKAPKPLTPDNKHYQSIVEQATAALAKDCVPLSNGGYKVKESINFSGERVWLKDDQYFYRKFTAHIPESVNPRNVFAPERLKKASEWLMRAPDSPPVQAYFKAWMKWNKYQFAAPPAYTPFTIKYGADNIRYFKELVPVLRKLGDGFKEELDYCSFLMMYTGNAYGAAWHKKENTANSLELGNALNIYQSLLYESDDPTLYTMLENYRNNWTMYLGISDEGRQGMIKPDYTFFHHGELSYWGNITGYSLMGKVFANTQLDFETETHRNLANHLSAYSFGPRNLQDIKGGQMHNWQSRFFEKEIPAEFSSKPDVKLSEVIREPSKDLFEYMYHLDWKTVPAARKFLEGVLGNVSFYSDSSREALLAAYPKLTNLTPQEDIFLSVNWTGACTYQHQMNTVYAMGGTELTTWRGGTPLRRYGSLLIGVRDHFTPLGIAREGYSWVRVPGNTMPALTEEEWSEMITGETTGGNNILKFGIVPIPGNGSLTFNETDNHFGTSGNFALKVDETTSKDSKWGRLEVSGLKGNKSYHFHGDKVVALGSNYEAQTDRSMRTVLIQDMVDPTPWSHRDYRRWNPSQPSLLVNGKTYQGNCNFDLPMNEANYFISPYGHSWIIPGRQKGSLKVDWAKRKTYLKWRFDNKTGGINPGGDWTNGESVIVSLEQDSSKPSSHHYCVVLNSNGKSAEELEAYTQQITKNPGYEITKQDDAAHIVVFEGEGGRDLYSYLIFKGNTPLNDVAVHSANKRINLMMQQNEAGDIALSVCDPHVGLTKTTGQGQGEKNISPPREIRIEFTTPVELVSSTSGLPQTNPPMNATISGENKNILSFTTANGVTDSFVIRMVK